MKHYTQHITIILLFTIFTSLFIPVTSAQAFSLSDVVASSNASSSGNSGSFNGLLNVLLALVLGKFLGGSSNATDIPSLPGTATDSKTTASNAKGDAIVKSAQKYMGVPYVWGGTALDGWDCSGYTQYVMKENGISIPRTAAEQYAKGTAVNKSKLKVGDLVFFTTYKPGASHVGFYMGNGKFIHASSAAKEVTINSLNEEYYTEHYIGARRYIQ